MDPIWIKKALAEMKFKVVVSGTSAWKTCWFDSLFHLTSLGQERSSFTVMPTYLQRPTDQLFVHEAWEVEGATLAWTEIHPAMLSPSLPVDQGQFQSQKQCLEGTWKVCEILVYMVVQSFSFMCHSGLIWCPFSISVSSYFCCFVCMLHICGWV